MGVDAVLVVEVEVAHIAPAAAGTPVVVEVAAAGMAVDAGALVASFS